MQNRSRAVASSTYIRKGFGIRDWLYNKIKLEPFFIETLGSWLEEKYKHGRQAGRQADGQTD